MKFKNILSSILLESKTSEKVIQKLKNLGVNDNNAKALGSIAGSIYRLLAFRILEKYESEYTDLERRYDMSKTDISKDLKERFNLINTENAFMRERRKVRAIVDWFRVGIGGVIKPYENLTFDELYHESEKWHESLGIGESKIDYKETNDILLDFRKNDVGFYWADLGVTSCPDEAERMGHCGSSSGYLYSLREYRTIENNHTLNKSLLTASVNVYGTLLQLKGAKNSKPKSEYYQYIIPLFYLKNEDDSFFIKDFGYEYNTENDFKMSDLTEDEIKKLYSDRPDLFKGRQEIKLLKKLGLIDATKIDYKFTWNIGVKYADDYLRGDYRHLVQDILNGDTYQYWENYDYADWKYAVKNEINENNIHKIIKILKDKNPDMDVNDDILEIIEEYDGDNEIQNAIRWSVNDAEGHEYENYLYKELKNAFSEYGNVIEMNDTGVKIEVNLEELISSNRVDDETIDELMDRCNDNSSDPECLFTELMSDGYINNPRFDLDERWYPSLDRNNFNDILNERLNEI